MTAANAREEKEGLFANLVFQLLMFSMLAVGIYNLYHFSTNEPKVVTIDTTINERAFWEKIVRENPTYRDGYLVLSEMKKREGSYNESSLLYNRASIIDPFLGDSVSLSRVLGESSVRK